MILDRKVVVIAGGRAAVDKPSRRLLFKPGILPTTIDTPANRMNMRSADPAKWVNPASITELLIFLSSDGAHRINGALIPIG
jgi:hypothetical protein